MELSLEFKHKFIKDMKSHYKDAYLTMGSIESGEAFRFENFQYRIICDHLNDKHFSIEIWENEGGRI